MPDPSYTGMMADITIAMRWLGLCLLLAAASIPVLLKVLRGLPDRGVALAPLAGILIATASAWWMGQDWTTGNGMRARLFLSAATIGMLGIAWLQWTTANRNRARKLPVGIHRDRLVLSAALVIVALLPLPFSFGGILCIVFLMLAVAMLMWWGDWDSLKKQLRRAAPSTSGAMILFICGFGAFLIFRAQLPGAYFGANHYGAEKAGNLMHLTSAMRTTWFPVGDAWFLGEPVNYYNGGHIAVAMLAKGSGALPGHAFNLGLATIFGLTLSTAFALGVNALHRPSQPVWRAMPWALLLSMSVGLFGNLDALHQVLARDSDSTAFDFWRSSRVFSSNFSPQQEPGTITEFPAFSAMLGDLHAHHMALPMGMLVATLLVSLWRKSHRLVATPGAWWRRCHPEVALLGLAMAAAFVVNAWDAVVYAPIVLAVVLATFLRVKRGTALSRQMVWPFVSLLLFCVLSLMFSAFTPLDANGDLTRFLATSLALAAAIGIAWLCLRSRGGNYLQRAGSGLLAFAAIGAIALLVALPHLLTFTSPFESQASLLVTTFPPRLSSEVFSMPGLVVDSVIQRTPLRIVPPVLRTTLWEYLTMWGLFVIPILGVLVASALRAVGSWPMDKSMALFFGSIALFLLLWNAMTALAAPVAGLLASGCFALSFQRSQRTSGIIWLLLAVAFLWHVFVEIFYFNDAYTGHLVRYNTPFKILYPTWPLLALGMTMVLRFAFDSTSIRMRGVQLLVLVVIVRLGLVYPFEGARARIAEGHPREGTLDALAWMGSMEQSPDDLALIRWMQRNIAGTPTLLEAPPRADSGSYTQVGRVSAATGIPTLIGWSHHESQWRGWSTPAPEHLVPLMDALYANAPLHPELFNSLAAQVDLIYKSDHLDGEIRNAIERLRIDLIFVGSIERERYGDMPGALEKFDSLEVVHRAGDSVLYRIARRDAP